MGLHQCTFVAILLNMVMFLNTSDISNILSPTPTATMSASLGYISSPSSIELMPTQRLSARISTSSYAITKESLATNSDSLSPLNQVVSLESSEITSIAITLSSSNYDTVSSVTRIFETAYLSSSPHQVNGTEEISPSLSYSDISSTLLNIVESSYSDSEQNTTHTRLTTDYNDNVSTLSSSFDSGIIYSNSMALQISKPTAIENLTVLSTSSMSNSIENMFMSKSVETVLSGSHSLQSLPSDTLISSEIENSTKSYSDSTYNLESAIPSAKSMSIFATKPVSCLSTSSQLCSTSMKRLNAVFVTQKSSDNQPISSDNQPISSAIDNSLLKTSLISPSLSTVYISIDSALESVDHSSINYTKHASIHVDTTHSTMFYTTTASMPEDNNHTTIQYTWNGSTVDSLRNLITPSMTPAHTHMREQPSSMTSLLQPSSTSKIYDKTVSYSEVNGTSVPPTKVTPQPKLRHNFRIAIKFKDHCKDLKSSVRLLEQFSVAIEAELRTIIGHSTLEDVHCNPLTAVIVLHNVSRETAIEEIDKHLGNSSFIVPVIYDGQLLKYTAASVSMFVLPTNSDPRLAETVMDELDIAIIAIGSFIFMVLLFFGSVAICRQCYLRKRAASFNLLDAPRSDLKLTDYTLTRIPRPRVIYCDPKPDRSRQALSDDSRTNRVYNSTGMTDNVHAALNPEDLRVRMHAHADGLVVGITCTPPPSPMHDSVASNCSSPRSDTDDQSSKQLLKRNNPKRGKGMENPNFEEDDELTNDTDGSLDLEKEGNDIEQMV